MLPDTFNGLPLHPLAVHATVVLVPLAALLGVAFAVPGLRRWSLVPLPLVAVAASVSAFVSTESGETLKAVLPLEGEVADLVERHSELAVQLRLMTLIFAVLALVTAAIYWRSLRGEPTRRTTLAVTALSVVLVLGAVALGVQSYRVGDSGSQAVWNPTGDQDYSTG